MSQNPTNRLPSLHGLRAFEAAARLGSFKAAAEALHVSPTAISHHIRGLEQEIGIKLFERHLRRVSLTAPGLRLSAAATASLTTLAQALDDIREDQKARHVTIAAGPFIAARWVIPLFARLGARFPDTELRLSQIFGAIDPATVDAEIILAWGHGDWPGFTAQKLWTIRSAPIANTAMARQIGALDDISKLLDVHLIHHRDHEGWSRWFANAGVDVQHRLRGTIIEDANMVVRSVMEGHGIALGWIPLINAEVESGDIVRLTEASFEEERSYFLLHRQDPPASGLIAEIASCLLDAALQG